VTTEEWIVKQLAKAPTDAQLAEARRKNSGKLRKVKERLEALSKSA
jgi:hypothetical protein